MTAGQAILVFGIGGFLLSCLLTAWLQGAGARHVRLVDHPGHRSLHSTPTPRTGGLAIAAGLLPLAVYLFITNGDGVAMLLSGWLLVFGISLADDVRALPFWVRLPVHLLAAALVVLASGQAVHPLLQALAIFWIAWGTNLFNFMDGMDGLAGSMAVIGGAAMCAAFLLAGAAGSALLMAGIAAAAAGFLCFNRPPARIFMGDAGSASLGFLLAATAVNGAGRGIIPAWLPLLVFLPFIADATFTLLRRAWQRKPVWQAHREHLYQALVLSGLPERKVLVLFAAAMLLCGGVALLLPDSGWAGWGMLGLFLVLSAGLYSGIMGGPTHREFRDKKGRGSG